MNDQIFSGPTGGGGSNQNVPPSWTRSPVRQGFIRPNLFPQTGPGNMGGNITGGGNVNQNFGDEFPPLYPPSPLPIHPPPISPGGQPGPIMTDGPHAGQFTVLPPIHPPPQFLGPPVPRDNSMGGNNMNQGNNFGGGGVGVPNVPPHVRAMINERMTGGGGPLTPTPTTPPTHQPTYDRYSYVQNWLKNHPNTAIPPNVTSSPWWSGYQNWLRTQPPPTH